MTAPTFRSVFYDARSRRVPAPLSWWMRARCPHGTPTERWINDVSHSAWLIGARVPMWVCNHCEKVWHPKMEGDLVTTPETPTPPAVWWSPSSECAFMPSAGDRAGYAIYGLTPNPAPEFRTPVLPADAVRLVPAPAAASPSGDPDTAPARALLADILAIVNRHQGSVESANQAMEEIEAACSASIDRARAVPDTPPAERGDDDRRNTVARVLAGFGIFAPSTAPDAILDALNALGAVPDTGHPHAGHERRGDRCQTCSKERCEIVPWPASASPSGDTGPAEADESGIEQAARLIGGEVWDTVGEPGREFLRSHAREIITAYLAGSGDTVHTPDVAALLAKCDEIDADTEADEPAWRPYLQTSEVRALLGVPSPAEGETP